METRKQAILDALDAFVAQRSGMDYRDYGDVTSYRSEQRSVTRDLHHYRAIRAAVGWRDSVTADMILEASRSAFYGRLTITYSVLGRKSNGVTAGFIINYCTGQYFPTEYRKAACEVLASALWYYVRAEGMPKGELRHNSETGETLERYDGMHAGDWLRAYFRRELGKAIAGRYFD